MSGIKTTGRPSNESIFKAVDARQYDYCVARVIEDMTPSDAYVAAYMGGEQGKISRRKIAYRAGCIEERKAVQNMMRHLRSNAQRRAQHTVDQHVQNLMRYRDKLERSGKFRQAADVEVQIGKCMGFYVERHMHLHAEMTLEQMDAQIKEFMADKEIRDAFLAHATDDQRKLIESVVTDSHTTADPQPTHSPD